MHNVQQTTFTITPAIKKEIVKIIDERVKKHNITKEDFSELKSIVRDIGKAQKRTEQRLEELTEAQKDLAEAQKRTEGRLEELSTGFEYLQSDGYHSTKCYLL